MLEEITPLILTYNEENNINHTLEKLKWASKIIVIDSYSTDTTLEILSSYPQVEVFPRKFDTHATQWNYGLEKVATEWVLSLDADYIVTDVLITEIKIYLPILALMAILLNSNIVYLVNPYGVLYSLPVKFFSVKTKQYILMTDILNF